MARVTVEDCLKRIPNRFFLVHAATKRVRQLREGSDRLIDSRGNEDIVTALREIAAGKVFVTRHYTESQETAPEAEIETPAESASAPAEPAASEPESGAESESGAGPESEQPVDSDTDES